MENDVLQSHGASAERYDALTRWVIGLFTLFCLFLAWRGGYWYDEVMTVRDAGLPFGEMLSRRAGWGHLPLYFSMSWGWLRLGNATELWMRMPSILFAACALWLIYDFVKQAAGSRAGFLAVVFVAVNPVMSMWTPQARMYTLLMCLGLLGLWLMLPRGRTWAVQRVGQAGHLVSLFVVTVLLVMTHYGSLLILPVWIILAICERRRGGWRMLIVILLGVCALLPWWGYANAQWHPGMSLGWQDVEDARTLVGVVSLFDLANLRAWSHGGYPWLLIGAMPGLVLLIYFALQRRIKRWLWLTVLGVPILFAWAMAWMVNLGIAGVDRYFLFSLGALSVLWALAVAAMEGVSHRVEATARSSNMRPYACAGMVGLMVFMGAAGNLWTHWQPAFFSYKLLLDKLATEAGEQEGILIMLPGYELRSLDHYFPRDVREENVVIWHVENPHWPQVLVDNAHDHLPLLREKTGWWVFVMWAFMTPPEEIAIVRRLQAKGFEQVNAYPIHNGGLLIHLTPDE